MRSYLFVPGDSDRKIDKALASDADVVIFDLEDSVAPDNKESARTLTAARLSGLDAAARQSGPLLYVRVNALDTVLAEADIEAIVPHLPHGIMQPKSRSGGDVLALSDLIGEAGRKGAVETGSIGIIVVATETAASLFNMGTYDVAGSRLRAMSWGAEDLSANLGATTNKDETGRYAQPYELARTLCLLGAVAAGVDPVDTVFVNFRDEAGLRAEAQAAMRDGFTAKLAIHPAQIPIINEVFTPSGESVERAQRIVDAFAVAGNAGVIGMDGEMLDRPHLSRAEKLLVRAAKYRTA